MIIFFGPAAPSTAGSTTVTVGDLATDALMDLGVLQPGEAMTADDGAFALRRLNDWLDAQKTHTLVPYTMARTVWTIVSGTQDYTIGADQTIDVIRPQANSRLALAYQDTTLSPTQEVPIPIFSPAQWDAISMKGMTGVYPTMAFYNPSGYATGVLSLYPIPTNATLQGVLYAPTLIGEFAALSDSLNIPPGYKLFFRSNITVEMAAAFGGTLTPETKEQARNSKADIKRGNTHLTDLLMDPGAFVASRSYSIWTDS